MTAPVDGSGADAWVRLLGPGGAVATAPPEQPASRPAMSAILANLRTIPTALLPSRGTGSTRATTRPGFYVAPGHGNTLYDDQLKSKASVSYRLVREREMPVISLREHCGQRRR